MDTLITNKEIDKIVDQNIKDDEILDVDEVVAKMKICFNKIMHICHDRHEEKLADLKEFVEDCSVSHIESRYKYRAQILINQLENK